jgi:GNAT superfamily N-acetyltransferase
MGGWRACQDAAVTHPDESAAAPPVPEPALAVRGRTAGDLGACVDLLAEAHRHDKYPRRWPDDPAGWLTRPSLIDTWVATLDGKVVGHVGLSETSKHNAAPAMFSGQAAMVTRLFVSPAARGHGVGRALMEQVVRAARERGLHPVLDVDSSSTAAITFYESLGWRRLGSGEAQWGSELVTIFCYAAPS